MSQKSVAYIDLLGFSDRVKNNPEEAILMLSHFNTILCTLSFEREVHPSSKYIPVLQGLARRTSNESFEHVMPFSDSVFIASSNCSDFIMQLGSFVRKSFMFNARVFANPANPADPMASRYIGVDTSNPKNIKPIDIPCHEPAVLFRGGIAYGEVIETSPMGMFNNQNVNCNNLMGEAVVRAVKMEGVVKGPRLIFDQSVYDQLNIEARLYCRPLPEVDSGSLYEILWPALGYVLENRDTFAQEINHFYDMFTPAYNLWRYYKGGDVAIHYECFLELIVSSAIKIFDHMGCGEDIHPKIFDTLNGMFTEDERIKIFKGVI